MLTQEERKIFQERWYSFEEIQKISDSYDAIEKWEVISEEEAKKKFLSYRKNVCNKQLIKSKVYV